MEHLNNQEKKLLQDIKNDGDAKAETEEVNSSSELEEQQQTTNGVF
jgi:hypothetical protein